MLHLTSLWQPGAPPRPGGRRALGMVVRWSADYQSAGLRRRLQVALGLLWLLDAALQYQPFMFGGGFARQVIVPAEAGNPGAVASPALLAAHVVSATQPAANAAFATAQLLLGLALLWRPAVKAGLAASVGWGLLVWWLGEGLGGVLAGGRLLTGAPGAAVLYALLAVLLWPAGHDVPLSRPAARASVAEGGLLGGRGARLAWLGLWASAAFLALEPASRAPGSLQQSVAGQAAGEPRFLAGLDHRAAALAAGHGLPASAAIAVIAVLVGCAVLIPPVTRPALVLAALLALAIWVIGENFGAILTGQGTDPNTGPLLILLAAAFWPTGRADGQAAGRRQPVREASATR